MTKLLPRCTHPFGYCAKTRPPRGKLTERIDEGNNFIATPKCKEDYTTCEHYRILTVSMQAPPARG